MSEAKSRWVSRITGEADVDPRTLIPNVANFRRHPKAQQNAMDATLDALGWIQRVIVNKITGNMIDGHLRVERALAMKESSVPVCYVELTLEEERVALATFDPISAMAVTDKRMFDELVSSIGADNPVLLSLLAKTADDVAAVSAADQSDMLKEKFEILITLSDENSQAELLFRLSEEGYECRSLIS